MATFSVPKTKSRDIYTVDKFLGVDFTNAPTEVSKYQSPDAVNMIRDKVGKVRKRMGFKLVRAYTSYYAHPYSVNGFHKYKDNNYIIHVDTKLYKNGTEEIANDPSLYGKSESFNVGNYMYIVTPYKFMRYDGTNLVDVRDVAYVPTVTIAKKPFWGGTPYEPINLIGDKFIETFSGTADDTAYNLSFDNLNSNFIEVYVLNQYGAWVRYENITFHADIGMVIFPEPPGVSPVTGEDNVKIIASKTFDGYKERIEQCSFGIKYGINDEADRLFLSGNILLPNYDWYSQKDDATYFPDTNYGVMGSAYSKIVGYAIINNVLATFKGINEDEQNIFLREGVLNDTNQPIFRMVGTMSCPDIVSPYTFQYLNTEPLFLTKEGIFAITTPDSGYKYAQDRSYFLNGKLLNEELNYGNTSFCSCVYKNMYFLHTHAGKVFVLDGLQNLTDTNEPYSNRQYAGYYLELDTKFDAGGFQEIDNITCMWVHNDKLYFGTEHGKVYEFYTDEDSVNSYNDNGKPIYSKWETPAIGGSLFYKNKTFRYLALRLKAAIYSSVKIYVQEKGIWDYVTENSDTRDLWTLLKEDFATAKYFSFTNLIFSKLSFSTNTTSKVIPTKIKVKKVDKAAFRFENGELNEPFGIEDYALEFVQTGNVK